MAKTKEKRSIGHVKKLSEGKYLLRLSLGYDDFGKRIQPSKVVTCSCIREADKLLHDFYSEKEKLFMQHNLYVPKTLGQLYDYWYQHHVKVNLSPKTQQWYNQLWSLHVSHASELKTEILSPAHVLKIIDAAKSARNKNAVYKMLSALFNKSVKWGYIQDNPCTRIDTPKYIAPEKKALTESEIILASEEIAKEGLKYQALFYFALLCSMRRQEIIALKWSDIDFGRSQFRIKRAAQDIPGKGTVAGDTKTEKSKRNLYLPDILKVILLQLRNEQNSLKHMYGDKWEDGDWVFTQQNGRIMNIHTPTNWWKEFSTKNNINSVTFHGLRHTAATFMIKNNVPISTVSGVLGHSNISTTLNTYTHVIEDSKKVAINIMENIVTDNKNKSNLRVI